MTDPTNAPATPFSEIAQAFRQTLKDCEQLYRECAQEIAHRHPQMLKQTPGEFIVLMHDLHKGLVTKIFVEISQSDWEWTEIERAMASELFDHLWGARPPAKKLRDALEQTVEQAGQLSWSSLVRPFAQLPPLKERISSLETVVVRLANLVAKADGAIQPAELRRLQWIQEELRTLLLPIPVADDGEEEPTTAEQIEHDYRPGRGQKSSKKGGAGRKSATPEASAAPRESLETVLAEMDALVGIANIKTEIRQLINFLKIQTARVEHGMPQTEVSLHMVFCGNPGTGKTTVARLVGRLLSAMGLLKKGHLVETDRSGLVAKFAGQTGPRTNEKIDESLDGVLFIDEAYSLVAESGDDPYGAEAVQALLKRVEDDRDRLVVVLAGYPEPMDRMLKSNPGMSSRFHRMFQFNDYTGPELGAIFQRLCESNQYQIPSATRLKLLLGFEHLLDDRDEHFGNGRLARNIFEKAILRLANRVASVVPLTTELLCTLHADDIRFDEVPPEVLADLETSSRRLSVACPGCAQNTRFNPQLLGRRAQCKKCEHQFRVDWGELVPN